MSRWMIERSDAARWLESQADDSIDLLFTSPPYEAARTYGIDFTLRGQAWVDWMFGVIKAAAPKVKGLIAVNCEGQTTNYNYSGTPFLLFADLKRAGFNMRKPPAFCRVGIPGSGGPDWLRNDYEPIICVTRPGKLPWSDNTACGHVPKWVPGGDLSNRHADGRRINAQLSNRRPRPSHATAAKLHTKAKPNGEMEVQGYNPPTLANPGNLIRCKVGGGQLGHPLAHENEAPFPLKLADFFIRSFCPPDGIVADCFAGSGTTGQAAIEAGRRFIGCDLRQSQVDLTKRRLSGITPLLLGA